MVSLRGVLAGQRPIDSLGVFIPSRRKCNDLDSYQPLIRSREISFSIGRPDTLGADIYHNRSFPLQTPNPEAARLDPERFEPPYCAIIECMVHLSRITRTICQKIYLTNPSIPDMIALTNLIESEIDDWITGLPEVIQSSLLNQSRQLSSLSAAKGAVWAKRQRLVLNIRYHNLKILLFGSLLMRSSATERANIPGCMENLRKCFESAKETITIIYETYAQHDFFQTWCVMSSCIVWRIRC